MFLLNQNSKTKGAAGKTAANLKAKDANLGEQTKEKVGASESNSNDKSSNLSELEAKFKRDYVNQKLSEYADVSGVADEIVKKVYPSYKKDLNNASIKWTEFNGAISELEESTPQRRFVNMLSSECAPEIDALIAKIKEIK